ncbi:NmrA-like domain containing protein [Pseudohyphozyma bogoriensis]|nr:NmrA-like domain containing protein [Pseudohyphozyma bogoriensis]
MAPKIFLVGVGFIGGSLLQSLVDSKAYEITALTRKEEQAEVLKKLSVKPVLGTLSDHDLIVEQVLQNEIIVHTATADDQPSVKAILDGLAKRPASATPAVYLHTSGTGVISTDFEGTKPPPHNYDDKNQGDVDALPESAPHRDVDLLIKNAVESGNLGKAKVGIILPPLIYGVGTGPFNKTSIQVPGWVCQSMKNKNVNIVGTGVSEWNHIHVANLVLAYRTIIDHLSSTSTQPPLYYFAETGYHTWLSLGEAIQKALASRNLLDAKEVVKGGKASYMGSNSRSVASRIRELGWKPEVEISVWDSVDGEVQEILDTNVQREFEERYWTTPPHEGFDEFWGSAVHAAVVSRPAETVSGSDQTVTPASMAAASAATPATVNISLSPSSKERLKTSDSSDYSDSETDHDVDRRTSSGSESPFLFSVPTSPAPSTPLSPPLSAPPTGPLPSIPQLGSPPTGFSRLRISTTHSDLSRWAPSRPSTAFPSGISHLPQVPDARYNGPTSFPNTKIPHDMKQLESSTMRLLSPSVFEEFLTDENGRRNFREYLQETQPDLVAQLDFWWDLHVLQTMTEKARLGALRMQDIYLLPGADAEVKLPSALFGQTLGALKRVTSGSGLEKPSEHLLSSLYAQQFQTYVRERLVQHASVKLGVLNLSPTERAGFAAFCDMTGYSVTQVVGRNCRFLQGSGTSRESIKSIKAALGAGEAITQLLLNYRLDGTPFWNLLSIIPLRDEKGDITYFIGGQTNVTATMTSGASLSFLSGTDSLSYGASLSPRPPETDLTFSQTIRNAMVSNPSTASPQVSNNSSGGFGTTPPQSVGGDEGSDELAPLSPSIASPVLKGRRFSLFGGKGKGAKQKVNGVGGKKFGEKSPELSPRTSSLEGRAGEASQTYDKVMLFRRKDREVLFVTPNFLEACGLPHSTPDEKFSSPLLHADVLDILKFRNKADAKVLGQQIKTAIAEAHPASIPCGVRKQKDGLFSKSEATFGVLHLTPMVDGGEECVACTAVFV